MAKEWQQRNPYLPVSLVGGSRRTALRELEQLVRLGVLVLLGRGRGAVYAVAKECARNVPKVPKARKATASQQGAPKGQSPSDSKRHNAGKRGIRT